MKTSLRDMARWERWHLAGPTPLSPTRWRSEATHFHPRWRPSGRENSYEQPEGPLRAVAGHGTQVGGCTTLW